MHRNPVDTLRPDAPPLARRGPHPVGVRRLRFTDPARIRITSPPPGDAVPGPRRLTVEAWYPAAPLAAPSRRARYPTVLRDGVTRSTLTGSARRDAPVATGLPPCPLVILSHGYPGNRYLMSHFAEALASRGYVVASIDHPASLYADLGAFADTLLNRPLDQMFVLDRMLARDLAGGGLERLIAPDRAGLIGYSMGGYGALIAGGAGLGAKALASDLAPPDGLLRRHAAGDSRHEALFDARLRAVLPIGPWGMNQGFWDSAGLERLRVPMLIMAGSADAVSGHDAMRAIFTGCRGVERHLLTFLGAGHNAAAPIPAPDEAWTAQERDGVLPFAHYADPAWDTVRMNNIAQHFAAAFLDLHLRGDADAARWLDGAGWPGLGAEGAAGLRLESLGAADPTPGA